MKLNGPGCRSFVFFLVTLQLLLSTFTDAQRLVLPYFTHLPSPVLYVTRGHVGGSFTTWASVGPTSTSSNTSVRLLMREEDLRGSLTSPPTRAMVRVTPGGRPTPTTSKFTVLINNWSELEGKALHWQVKNALGRLVSRPFMIQRQYLNQFPLVSSEYFDFFMGNVGRVTCLLPRSNPSPPTVIFTLNQQPIKIEQDPRYRVIFLSRHLSGEMVLLIRNLNYKDSGDYGCSAQLGDMTAVSEKKTNINVQTPQRKVKTRFRFSSHQPNQGQLQRPISVLEGANLTLFCVFESTPVSPVTWYYENQRNHIRSDSLFGTITFNSIRPEDSSKYTCFPQEDNLVSKTFTIKVKKRLSLTLTPETVQVPVLGGPHTFHCKANYPSTKIQWIFNGENIDSIQDKRFEISDSKLYIVQVTNELLGIYQCWTRTLDNQWISKTATLTLLSDSFVKKPSDGEKAAPKATEIRTAASITAHLKCYTDASSSRRLEVRWYRNNRELVARNFRKYNVNADFSNLVVLSLIGPEKSDQGYYTCKIFDSTSKQLISEKVFKVVIVDEIGENRPPKVAPEVPNVPKVIERTPITARPPVLITTEPPNKHGISLPSVSRPSDFLLAVSIGWEQTDTSVAPMVHFRIEIRSRDPTYSRRTRVRRQSPWSDVILIDTIPKGTTFIVDSSVVNMKAGLVYSFRVLGVPSEPRAAKLSSPWSQEVSFQHLLPQRPSITKVQKSTASLQVFWRYPSDGVSVQRFHILCRLQSARKGSGGGLAWTTADNVVKVSVSVLDTRLGAVITNLLPGRRYIIAMYAEKTQNLKPSAPWITMLSDERIESTLVKPVPNVNPGSPASGSHIRDDLEQDIEEAYQHRMVFLVLGSLSGVLFVVAAILLAMCVWYQVRRRHKRRGRSPPPYLHPGMPPVPPHPGPGPHNGPQWIATPVGGTLGRRYIPVSAAGPGGTMDPTQLESLGLMVDYRMHFPSQTYHQQQADQASSIYSQIGSEAPFSNFMNLKDCGSPTNQDLDAIRDEDLALGSYLPPYNTAHLSSQSPYQAFYAANGGLPPLGRPLPATNINTAASIDLESQHSGGYDSGTTPDLHDTWHRHFSQNPQQQRLLTGPGTPGSSSLSSTLDGYRHKGSGRGKHDAIRAATDDSPVKSAVIGPSGKRLKTRSSRNNNTICAVESSSSSSGPSNADVEEEVASSSQVVHGVPVLA